MTATTLEEQHCDSLLDYGVDSVGAAGVALSSGIDFCTYLESSSEHFDLMVGRLSHQLPCEPNEAHEKKVLRRLHGFLVELDGPDAKVAFVEDGATFEYYLPARQLLDAGIKFENQPFQMDEISMKTERGCLTGYEFQPLAKHSDAFRDSFKLDEERERKRDMIFKAFHNAKN